MTKKRAEAGTCIHCGISTTFAWMDSRTPAESPMHLCVGCMNRAVVGYYTSPAYERVGQATYHPLLSPKPE